jgi:PilZ domain
MMVYVGKERRKHPRYRVSKSGEIRSGELELLAKVQVFELSVGGARFLTDTDIAVPDSFGILFAHEPVLYPSRLIWRSDRIVGVEFSGEPTLLPSFKLS